MTSPYDQEYMNLLSYEQVDTDEYFVTTVINQIQKKRKFRSCLLAFASICAGFTAAFLLLLYGINAWHPLLNFVSQSPFIVASAIIVGIMSVTIISSQEVEF